MKAQLAKKTLALSKTLESGKKSEKDIDSHKARVKAKTEAILNSKHQGEKNSDEKVVKSDKKSLK